MKIKDESEGGKKRNLSLGSLMTSLLEHTKSIGLSSKIL